MFSLHALDFKTGNSWMVTALLHYQIAEKRTWKNTVV